MRTLFVLIPGRTRSAATEGNPRANGEYLFATSIDGLAVESHGRAAPALLPRADSVIAVLDDADVSWHRITLPRTQAARMQAALHGVLEEALLDELAALHLALSPQAAPGQPCWVAAVHRPWLAGELAALERARVFVERVVPTSWPDEPASGHFALARADAAPGDLALTWSSGAGVVTVPLKGTLASTLLPDAAQRAAGRWSATPAAAAPAERWLGVPVVVMSEGERALMASRSLWNLRQFDLAARHRGSRALSDFWRRLRSPDWRVARMGLAALALVQLLGLNLWAWHQRAEVDARRTAMNALLRATFPQVRAVLDAPVQMQREVDSLRAAAGRAGEADLEPLLGAAAAAWPVDRPPVETLRYEPGRLTLAAGGWSQTQRAEFGDRLRAEGWRVDAAEGRLSLSRATGGAL